MRSGHSSGLTTGRLSLSPYFALTIVVLCMLPTLLNLAGFSFATFDAGMQQAASAPSDSSEGNTGLLPIGAAQNIHTIMEWTVFCTALLTGLLALMNFRMTRSPAVLLIGTILLLAGMLDAFHVIVSYGLIQVAMSQDQIMSLSWVAARHFNAALLLLCAMFLLFTSSGGEQRTASGIAKRFLWIIGLATLAMPALMAVQRNLPAYSAPASQLEFITQPLELLPMLLFLIAGLLVLPGVRRRYPTFFIHAVCLSMLPAVFVQLHMGLGSQQFYDNHFTVAHLLKILTGVVPLIGLAMDNIWLYRQVEAQLSQGTQQQQLSAQQLAFSENRLKAVLDNAAEAIITINERGVIQDFNMAAVDMFGYGREMVIGQNVSMLMPQRTAVEHDSYINAHLETGVSKIIGIGREIIARRSDGTEFFANLAVSKVRVGEGYLFTGIIHDIDERKRAELSLKKAFEEIENSAREQRLSREQLALSEDRLKAVLDNAAEAIITINERAVIQDFNLAAVDMFGYSRDRVIGQNVAMLMPKRTAVEHDGYISAHLETGVSKIIGIGREIIAQRSDGTEFFANLAVSKVRVGEGYLFTGIIHDIDERKRAEISLKQAYEDIEMSNRELDEFAYIASHDLKEPLRGISNYAQFLLEDYEDKLDEEGREMLRTLPRLTGNLDKLLNELLEYSRVGRADLQREQVDLHEVLLEVLDSLDFVLREAGMEVRVPRPLPVAYCDSARVSEVFRNLITNAIKYNDKEHPWVEIGFRDDEKLGIPVFHVSDNGIGIEPEFRDKVWVIFRRLHGKQKYGGGSGVGLSIVKKIIERHEGQIWIESEVGKGTSFLFTFSRGRLDSD